MRQQDKEVDGPELVQAEQRKRKNELVEEDVEELYDLDGKPALTRDDARTEVVSAAMRSILAREHIIINDLDVSLREQHALEALKTAVDGRDQEIDHFVYAEDRRTLLEQALAVLQPDLVVLQQLGHFDVLLHEIAELRERLDVLEDAEEEHVDGRHFDAAQAEGDRDDKPKPEDEESDEDLSLDGPERPPPPKPPTTLGDPEEIAAAAKIPWWRRADG